MKTFEVEPIFCKTVLNNGVRILTEHHPASRTVCAGITVNLGTRDEPDDIIGAAHFVEHMVFKGTQTRDAYEIARSLEAVGGDLNAYTTREETCFYASCLKEHLPLAMDVLTDLMSNAEFESNELKKEREVIIQELNMTADQLDEYVFDMAFEKSFKGHELSRSILGNLKTLQALTRKRLYEFYVKRYHGQNMIVSVAGHVDHEAVVRMVERSLSLKKRSFQAPERRKPLFKSFSHIEHRRSEQEHLLLCMPSVSSKDRFRFEAYIANAALGGGMTSRLYQKIREKLGLAYTVYSYQQPFSDAGLQTIYAATSAKHIPKVLEATLREVEHFFKKGLTEHEIEYYKRQVVGSLILESDDVETRMSSLVFNETAFGEYRPVDRTIAELQKIGVEDMQVYLKKYFDLNKLGLVMVGSLNEDRMENLANRLVSRYRPAKSEDKQVNKALEQSKKPKLKK